jgi:hypothetical protein
MRSGVCMPILKELLDGAEGLLAWLPEAASLLRAGGWPLELLVIAGGAALLVAGARLGRVLAAAGAALVGWFTGLAIAPAFQRWGVQPDWVGLSLGSALAVASFLAPDAYPLLLGVFPGALLGARVTVAGHASIGAAAGALAFGATGLALRKVIPAVTASVAGSALVCVALAALVPQPAAPSRASGLARFLTEPPVLLGIALVLSIAGTAFQLGRGRGGGRRGLGDHRLLRED